MSSPLADYCETERQLVGFHFDGDELTPWTMGWYVCPECEEGHVTDHGGGVYICGNCRWQL